ncbi:39S ribosomal protein L54, mitochondrial [Halotydeus destructor]|nr:39S ribosomal protein L54, mitochondrial [Halotydeus destructor]
MVFVNCRFMAAFKGTQSTGKKRFRIPTQTEAGYIVSNVSGSNIFKEGEDVKIKDDSEYPDWIWTMNLGPPLKAAEVEYGTRDYWEKLAFESNIRVKRFMKVKHKETMRLGKEQKKVMDWQNRIKFRALASYNFDAGWDPKDFQNEPDKKLWLKPQEGEELLYPDAYAAENPRKFQYDGKIGIEAVSRVNRKITKNTKH